MEEKNAMTKPVVKVRMSIRNASHRVDVDVDARRRKRRTVVKNLNADHTTKAYRYKAVSKCESEDDNIG